MIKQPPDRFEAMKDKRAWDEIRRDRGYWKNFWIWKNGPLPAQAPDNVVNIKEAAHG